MQFGYMLVSYDFGAVLARIRLTQRKLRHDYFTKAIRRNFCNHVTRHTSPIQLTIEWIRIRPETR